MEAVPRTPLALPLPVDEIRDAYLDPAVDRQALDFYSIFLGGSVVKQQTGTTSFEFEAGKDWDGFGILETKDAITRLIRDFRVELCNMLRIEKEEFPYMKVLNRLIFIQISHLLTFV